MATKNQSSGDTDDDTAFKRVQSHPDFCGNCFRKTHVTYERNYAVDIVKVDDFEWELWPRKVELPDHSYPVYENRVPVPQEPVSHGTVNYCKCGFPPGEQFRPLPKKLFFSYAENLYQRYLDMGVVIDETRFFEVLETLKTDPAEQFADDRLFDKATNQVLAETSFGTSEP